MEAIISDKIYIYNAPPQIKAIIKKALTIPNPVYQVMLRKNNMRALYAIKKNFKYYVDAGDILVVGRGCEQRLKRLCSKLHVPIDIKYRLCRKNLKQPFVNNNLVLREYQVGIPEQILKHKNGIIKLSVAFGKTIIACKLIEETQLKTLIILPRNIILDQFKETLEKFYNYSPGIIQGTVYDIKDITLVSVSTLAKRDLSDIKNKFGMAIIDECHQFITDIRLKTLQQFNPMRFYGMSGTVEREDGQGDALYFTFGDIVVDKELPQAKPKVEIVKSDIEIEVEEYADMIKKQIFNSKRNLIITRKILSEITNKRKILVLTKRVAHYEYFYQILNEQYKIFKLTSNVKNKKEQKELIEKLRNNKVDFDVILGTYSLLSTGFNVPSLDTIVFAGDLSSDTLNVQSMGRIRRIFEGKQDPKVIDIDDVKNAILHRQALKRRREYKEMGLEILTN